MSGEENGVVLRITRKGSERVVSRWRRRCGGVCTVCNTLSAYRGFRAREETKRKGGRERDVKEGKRWREGDNDWNKIFTAAAGAGP